MINKDEIIELVLKYKGDIEHASKESTKIGIFKTLLSRLYAGKGDIQKLIDLINEGTERTILDIPRTGKSHRGSADTLYSNIIIEFENDLKKTGDHAKTQLAGYLLGQYRTSKSYNYTLIASDLVTWKVYSPSLDQIEILGSLEEHELILEEVKAATFILTQDNAGDFYFWIDRYLFREEKIKATLAGMEQAFGHQSPVFIASMEILRKHFEECKKYGEVQVSMQQWASLLSIAYGKFEATDNVFLIHTYLSIFSKILAYNVLTNDDFIDEQEMKSIISGQVFQQYHVINFVENDFFHWVDSVYNRYYSSNPLLKLFRLISQEINNYEYDNVNEDILKGVYQELIDLDTRHGLGEYYTPDWLCERIVAEYDFKKTDKIMDPSCGSGSFLRAAISRLRFLHPDITVEELSNAVTGIDVHPLSVQIAKTTMLLALGDSIKNVKQEFRLNIIMANTLVAPEGAERLFGEEFKINIDKTKRILSTSILNNLDLFDDLIELCDLLANATKNKVVAPVSDFEKMLNNNTKLKFSNSFIDSFYKIYLSLKETKEQNRDTIWKFILTNVYKPFFLKEKFDYIIGNPPWFTYRSIKNIDYQELLFQLAKKYQVVPTRAANMAQMEIAAIFLAHCSSYFLKKRSSEAVPASKIAFVLPRSFFTGDQHINTRSAASKGFKITGIWDLKDVTPLFNIPSCVFFADNAGLKREFPVEGVAGLSFSGRLKHHNAHWDTAKKNITEINEQFYVKKLGKSTAISTNNFVSNKAINAYKDLFKNGATIFPRNFYFIDFVNGVPEDFEGRYLSVVTSEGVKPDAKAPWKGNDLSGRIESEFVFLTAISRSIVPYCIHNPDYIVLPAKLNERNELKLFSSDELLAIGCKLAHTWFKSVENIWNILKTDKSKDMTNLSRLDFQKGITTQDFNRRFIVFYSASAKDANAGIVDREQYRLPFVADNKSYVYFTNNEDEAHYLLAFLNSGFANIAIKDFQTTGLFGPRDVSKKILDVYFPKYDANLPKHVQLAALSKVLRTAVETFVSHQNMATYRGAIGLGKLRSAIKAEFATSFKQIDGLVQEIAKE